MADELESNEDLTPEEEQALRNEIAAEEWGLETPPAKEPKEEPKEEPLEPEEPEGEEGQEDDQWAGVPTALRDQFDSMTERLSKFEEMENRLKQAEKRVGSIQNELSAAKKAASEVKESPSPEQMAEAAETDEKWKELKEEFPEWAGAIDSRLTKERKELLSLVKNMPTATALREELEGKIQEVIKGVKSEITDNLQGLALGMVYPDYEKTVKTKKYTEWLVGQPDDIKKLTTSPLAKDAVKVLDAFFGVKPSDNEKSPSEIAAARTRRLKQSQTVKGRSIVPPKSDEDMNEEELRQKIAKEVWNE